MLRIAACLLNDSTWENKNKQDCILSQQIKARLHWQFFAAIFAAVLWQFQITRVNYW